MEPVTQLLSDLVAIPSMNPMGRSRSGKEYTEQAIAEYVVSFLKKHSIDAHLQQVEPNRPNVIAYVDVKAPQTILLEAHLDTVHADNMVIEPFTPVIREGKLYGRGSCDTKGSLAAFLQAVANTSEEGRLRQNVVMLFACDEEYRFTGATYAANNGLKADFGITGEPTQLRIVRAHKGVTRWKVWTRGAAAHSAYPERGKNAIYAMARVIGLLEEYAAKLTQQQRHPLLGTPTMSVGVIEGGQAVNIVPDRCWVEIDRRSLPGDTKEEILQEVRAVIQDVRDWEFEEPYLSVPGMEVSDRAPIIKMLSEAIQMVGGNVVIETASYATDAGVYNAAGIPTVVFGPGDIAQAHTANEWIELDQVRKAVEILCTMIVI